jgi:peptidyl-prolyl cis-trans isomerase C
VKVMLFLAVLGGCQPQAPAPPPKPVPGAFDGSGPAAATVDGTPVPMALVDGLYDQLPPSAKKQLEQMGGKGPLVEQVVDIELLYRQALKKGLADTPEAQAHLAIATRKALADMAIESAIAEQATDEKMRAWYNDHQVRFAGEQIHLSHILVKDEAEAKDVMKALAGGADFATLAAAKSLDTNSKIKGGELGWFSKKDMGGPLGAAAFAAQVGKPAGPIQSPYGYHVILVTEKRNQAPYEDVKDTVKDELSQDLARSYIEDLRKNAKIEMGNGPATPALTPPPAGAAGAAPAPAPAGAAPAPAGAAPPPETPSTAQAAGEAAGK